MGMGVPPSARRGRRRAPMADINVTPLVDVMLVLLIIFMVTAPLLVTGVPVKLPENRAKALETDEKPTVISVTAQGQLYFNETEITEAELPDRLADFAAAHAGLDTPQIFLRADEAINYGQVSRVLGELNRAGLNKISLVSNAEGGNQSDSATATVSDGSE
ncbi:MAG: ExbD/TolR family protein [Sphingobium sp.]|nr:ExbD/TolR family protein [Sphingobium sp.]